MTPENQHAQTGWKQILTDRLPLYGHRNWIVIADSAYPSQSRRGIETVITGAGQTEAVIAVLQALAQQPHIKPIVYIDAELGHVAEDDAPGVSAYRQRLGTVLSGRTMRTLPHEDIIALLDRAAQTFHVLILKTTMTIPYTSVFLELDCAYWSEEAEKRLRAAMRG